IARSACSLGGGQAVGVEIWGVGIGTSVKSQTVTRKQTVAENFSFKQSALETPIKVVEKGGYCFLKISADVQ
ncbi:Short-chain dehydrogenase/reductase like YusS, partial [Dissostichus eleginoides]